MRNLDPNLKKSVQKIRNINSVVAQMFKKIPGAWVKQWDKKMDLLSQFSKLMFS